MLERVMPYDALPIEVIRRSERADPIDDRKLRLLLDRGTWTKIAPGSFAVSAQWKALKPIERHRVRVLEGTRRMRPGAVISHFSAAAEWEIDLLGAWPTTLDVTVPRSGGGRSSGLIRRHTASSGMPETVPFGIHRITTPAQTALDLARILSHTKAVSAVDQAIWAQRPGGALTTRDEILELREGTSHRGNARALRAIEFSEALASNPRESQSRVVIARLGFPRPRLQERRVLRTGRLVFGDFYFPQHDHWAELDGEGKYRSPEFGRDRDAAAIVIDEKNRENEIRREVSGFTRFETADIHPRRLYDILTGDGVPSRLPRP
jgi:hypothetical protein